MKTFYITLVAACSLSAARAQSVDVDNGLVKDAEIVLTAEGPSIAPPTASETLTPAAAVGLPLSTTQAASIFLFPEETAGYNRPQLPPAPPLYAWGGFISQSWVKSSKGVRLSGPSDSRLGSFQRSEAGIYGTYSLNPYVDFRGMVSMFRDGRFDDGRPQINYGLVDIHDQDSDYGVRLGYISNSTGFFSEQLNVPTFRDLELAPQGLYRESYRHLTRGGRGVQAYIRLMEYDGWWLSVEGSHFKANVDDQEELSHAFFANKDAAEFKASSNFSTASIRLRNTEHGLILRYDRNDLDLGTSGRTNPRYDGSHELTVHRWGIRKYFKFGDITAERAKFHFRECGSIPCNYPLGQPVAADIMYRHYITPELNLILGYDTYYLGSGDRSGRRYQELFAARGVQVDREIRFSKTLSAGLHWKRDKWTYKAEIHHVEGQATMLAAENDLRRPDVPKRYNILLLNAVFAF